MDKWTGGQGELEDSQKDFIFSMPGTPRGIITCFVGNKGQDSQVAFSLPKVQTYAISNAIFYMEIDPEVVGRVALSPMNHNLIDNVTGVSGENRLCRSDHHTSYI